MRSAPDKPCQAGNFFVPPPVARQRRGCCGLKLYYVRSMQRLLVIIFCIMIQGCVFTNKPSDDADFKRLDKLDSVAGCYQNMGQSPPNSPDRYLSQVFWPESIVAHKSIDYIEVSVTSPETVVASAYSENGLVKQSEFHEGQHFKFQSGKITITNKLFGSLAYPAGNPFIGAGHTSVILGIDEQGHGKLTEKSTIAGTAFLFIPVAGQTSDTVRFIRIGESCQ